MKTYAITGAASGIGAAITKQLQDAGHRVITIDRQYADIVADLSTTEGRQYTIQQLLAIVGDNYFGGLDGFIPCAGVGSTTEPSSLVVKINYFGAVQLVEALKPVLVKNQGAVVMIASSSATMSTDSQLVDLMLAGDEAKTCDYCEQQVQSMGAYSGSKNAICRWTRNNAAEYAKQGVRINAIAPGHIDTALSAKIEEDPVWGAAIKQFVQTIPIGRTGEPNDVANLISFILSDAASYMAGSVIFLDGGHDAQLRPEGF